MAKETKTIDNLGLGPSIRYAEDQKELDVKILKESKIIPQQAEIDVTVPYFPSEFEALLETQKRNAPWALFYAPLRFSEQKRRLFSHSIIPSLGSEDKNELLIQRVSSRSHVKQQYEESIEWQEKREIEDEEREKKILIALLTLVNQLNKVLIDINSRRGQYHKG
jgi:hypothetical protein